MVYIAIDQISKQTVYADKVKYDDTKKRDKKYICVDCNGLLSYINSHKRIKTIVDAHFRHKADTKCNMEEVTDINYLEHAAVFINKWMDQIRKEYKYIKSEYITREHTDIVNLNQDHIYVKYTQCTQKIIKKREIIPERLIWILSISKDDEYERTCKIYKIIGRKGDHYLINTNEKTDLYDYDLGKSMVYLDDGSNVYEMINREENTHYNLDGKKYYGILAKKIDVNELANKFFEDISVDNKFVYNKKIEKENNKCVYTTNAYKRYLIKEINKKMYWVKKITNVEYDPSILTIDATIKELKYYCNQIKIFLGMNNTLVEKKGKLCEIMNKFARNEFKMENDNMSMYNYLRKIKSDKRDIENILHRFGHHSDLTIDKDTIKLNDMYGITNTVMKKIIGDISANVSKIRNIIQKILVIENIVELTIFIKENNKDVIEDISTKINEFFVIVKKNGIIDKNINISKNVFNGCDDMMMQMKKLKNEIDIRIKEEAIKEKNERLELYDKPKIRKDKTIEWCKLSPERQGNRTQEYDTNLIQKKVIDAEVIFNNKIGMRSGETERIDEIIYKIRHQYNYNKAVYEKIKNEIEKTPDEMDKKMIEELYCKINKIIYDAFVHRE